jgi:hypothetical protein
MDVPIRIIPKSPAPLAKRRILTKLNKIAKMLSITLTLSPFSR